MAAWSEIWLICVAQATSFGAASLGHSKLLVVAVLWHPQSLAIKQLGFDECAKNPFRFTSRPANFLKWEGLNFYRTSTASTRIWCRLKQFKVCTSINTAQRPSRIIILSSPATVLTLYFIEGAGFIMLKPGRYLLNFMYGQVRKCWARLDWILLAMFVYIETWITYLQHWSTSCFWQPELFRWWSIIHAPTG